MEIRDRKCFPGGGQPAGKEDMTEDESAAWTRAQVSALMHAMALLYAGFLSRMSEQDTRTTLDILADPFEHPPGPGDDHALMTREALTQLADMIISLRPPGG